MGKYIYIPIGTYYYYGTKTVAEIAYFSSEEKAKEFINECGYTKKITTVNGVEYHNKHYIEGSDTNYYQYFTIRTVELDKEDTKISLIKNMMKTISGLEDAVNLIDNKADKKTIIKSLDDVSKTINNVTLEKEILDIETQMKLDSVKGTFDNIDSVNDL